MWGGCVELGVLLHRLDVLQQARRQRACGGRCILIAACTTQSAAESDINAMRDICIDKAYAVLVGVCIRAVQCHMQLLPRILLDKVINVTSCVTQKPAGQEQC